MQSEIRKLFLPSIYEFVNTDIIDKEFLQINMQQMHNAIEKWEKKDKT